MKNIIIIGPPRTGKSTLSKIISKNISCYNAINTDVIREGIYEAFFLNTDKKDRKEIVRKAFLNFINKMLEQYQKYYNPDLYYVIEGDMLSIEDALYLKKLYEIDIICVGTPNITEENLFKRIRENSLKYGCWTKGYSDNELFDLCHKIINQSRKEKKISGENNIIYLDTSVDYSCLLNYVEELKMQNNSNN